MSYIIRTGNLTGPPDLRHDAESGRPYAFARVAVNDSAPDESNEWTTIGTEFYNLTVRGNSAENLAEAAASGGNIRIVFAGYYRVRNYTRHDGSSATSRDVRVDQIGVSLLAQTVMVTRPETGTDEIVDDWRHFAEA